MMDKDIFDLKNVDDLPKPLINELVAYRVDKWEVVIIDLLSMRSPLSLDQLMVGYFRKYDQHITRRQLTAKMYQMCRAANPKVDSIIGRKGLYRLSSTAKYTKKGAA